MQHEEAPFDIVIETVPLADVREDNHVPKQDPNKRFNTNNHWPGEDEGVPPDDYEEVLKAGNTSNWVDAFHRWVWVDRSIYLPRDGRMALSLLLLDGMYRACVQGSFVRGLACLLCFRCIGGWVGGWMTLAMPACIVCLPACLPTCLPCDSLDITTHVDRTPS